MARRRNLSSFPANGIQSADRQTETIQQKQVKYIPSLLNCPDSREEPIILRLKFLVIMAMLAMMFSSFAAHAQVAPDAAAVNQAAQVSVAPEDIPTLIENLAGGSSVITQVRFFANGELLDEGYTPVIERKEGAFDPAMKTLTILGTLGGSPVVEDIRFLAHGGVFYVLNDTYLDRETIEKTPGRLLPTRLETELAANQGDASPMLVTAKVATPAPTITSVGGNSISGISYNGAIAVGSCGPSYNGYYLFDTIATTATGRPLPDTTKWPSNAPYLTINGKNFGAIRGTIKFGPETVNANSQVSGQLAIVNWGPTQITFVPGFPFNSSGTGLQQGASMVLSVTTSTGLTTPVYAITALPAIGQRPYGQCTWYVAYERILSGKNPPDAAYPEIDLYGSGRWHPIDATYVPQLWDVFVWKWTDNLGSHQHTGIIVKVVQTAATKNVTTWSIIVGEMNYNCLNSISDLNSNSPSPSTFQVNIVNGKPTTFTWTTSTRARANLLPYSYYR